MSEQYFITYPDIDDPDFYEILYKKNEFNKTAYKTSFRYRQTEELCKKGEFKMQNHQEFIRNFMSPETPYNGALLFHGTGVGKTCAAIGATEGLRNYVKAGGKIYIISPETIEPNFRKELYDPVREAIEKEYHSMPGSYQCAGDAYYASTELATKRLISTYYEFMGAGKFCNFVDIHLGAMLPKGLKQPRMLDKDGNKYDIGDYFANSVIVIDEAHGIAGIKTTRKDDAPEASDEASELQASQEEEAAALAQQQQHQDAEVEFNMEEDDATHKIEGKRAKAYISTRSILRVLLDTIIPACHAKGRKLKIILLTATPMKDNIRELGDLLELLNANDGRMTPEERASIYSMLPKTKGNADDINDSMEQLRDRNSPLVKGIKKLARGYISYVKGNNPITFPTALLPDPEYLYEPGRFPTGQLKTMFPYRDQEAFESIAETRYNILLENGEPFRFNLVKCPMSIYQLKYYMWELKGLIKKKGSRNSGDIYSRMVSNFALPCIGGTSATDQGVAEFIDGSYTSKLLLGKPAFDAVFTTRKISKKSKGKLTTFEYKPHIFKKYGDFLRQDNELFPLRLFSRKFDMFMNFIKREGISYAYSEFIEGGALLAALMLEANGFVRFVPELKEYLVDGLPPADIHEKCPTAHMFVIPGREHLKPKEFYICARCGLNYYECRQRDDMEQNPALKHKFNVSTYVIVAGDYGDVKDIAEASNNNIYGEKIKVILGTKKTGQGVDLKWVRQIHILDPWHNNTRIYQAIGRGIRHCSHADLPYDMRNVTVYKYCSVPDDESLAIKLTPDSLRSINYASPVIIDADGQQIDIGITYQDFFTETVDEHMYQRVISKDLQIKAIERICKEAAIDCELNRMRNYFPGHDVDFSRECDYTLCKYSCDGFKVPVKYIRRVRRMVVPEAASAGAAENVRWFIIDDENDVKAVEDLTSIPHLARRALHRLNSLSKGATSLKDSQHVWDLLKPANMIIRDREYEDMLVDIPLIDVDNSTYDVYFSLPQVDRAIKIITRIFQDFQALSLETIINQVSKKDSELENEYIYLAMDKLVGSPPKVQPMTIIDKYGRRGYLIYHNGFYIYQPREIKDTRIPLAYRSKPLQIKTQYFEMGILEPKRAVEVIDRVSEVDHSSVTKELQLIRAEVRDPIASVSFITKLYMTLNKYTPSEHKIIIETLVESIFSTNMLDISTTDAYILEYYLRMGLVLFGEWQPIPEDVAQADVDPNVIINNNIIPLLDDMKRTAATQGAEKRHIIHFLTANNVRKYAYNAGWRWDAADSDTIQYYRQDRYGLMCPSAPAMNDTPRGLISVHLPLNVEKHIGGFYALMSRPSDIRVLATPDDTFTNILKKAVVALHTTYTDKAKMEKVAFKIVDQFSKDDTKKGTKAEIKGIACTSVPADRSKETHGRLSKILDQVYDDTIGIYEILPKEDFMSLLTLSMGDTKTICLDLQKICIILDYYGVYGVKWYLTPMEAEIYRPIQTSIKK